MSQKIDIPASSPDFPAVRANRTPSNQQNQNVTKTTTKCVLVLPPPRNQMPTIPLERKVDVQWPRVATRRLPPKQWEVMQALLNPEFEGSAPLLQNCYETYKWTREDAVSFAISGVPEPRTYRLLPIRTRGNHVSPSTGTPLPDSVTDEVGMTNLEAHGSERQEIRQSVDVKGINNPFPL